MNTGRLLQRLQAPRYALAASIGVGMVAWYTAAALTACSGGSSQALPVPVGRAPKVGLVDWRAESDIPVTGHYTPFVFLPAGHIRSYSNVNSGGVDGRWYVRDDAGPYRLALEISDPRDRYVRTSGVARLDDDSYIALLMTGDAYPSPGGYTPSLATSPDGIAWSWHGSVSPFGRIQSSSGALIAGAGGCEAWTDGTTRRLVRMVAELPCTQWEAAGGDEWPDSMPDDSPQFCSASSTPFGTHLICANGYPASRHRHLFRPSGSTSWCVLEDDAPTITEKGAHLAFDGSRVHAIADGRHLSFPARSYPCV